MKNEAKDVKEAETCKSAHKYQYVEVGKDGYHWQYCLHCTRELLVR